MIQRVVQDHQAAVPDRHIEVSCAGDLAGVWDADRLNQVASNLVGNALQHGDTSDPVSVRLDGTSADAVTLSVTNAGRIAADVLPHIFDPFRGGERAVGRSEGLGLGLYIVQQIVQAHQGSVQVQSEGATVFVVKVPRSDAEVVEQ